MAKNPCGKTVTPEQAYEVWASADETWMWFVLKKYKSPESEAKDPYARYYCAVQSPMTNGRFEYGDVYATEVKNGNQRIANPLVSTTGQDMKCSVCFGKLALDSVGTDATGATAYRSHCADCGKESEHSLQQWQEGGNHAEGQECPS